MSEDHRHTSSVRRLAAIMFTDIAGYSALMGKDEDQAFKILRKNREIHKPIIKRYGGEWLKEMGDGVLASFHSSSDAVRCAGEIQRACKKEGIVLRIGIHEGEVVFEGGDVFGDGVNIASRLEEIADEGGINISGAIYKDIKNKKGITARFLEEKTLKNLDEPVKVYHVQCEEEEFHISDSEKKPLKKNRIIFYLMVGFAAVLGSVLIWWFVSTKKEVASSITDYSNMEISVAVKPFDNISRDPEQEVMCDGLTEEIIHHLTTIKDFDKVISRSSCMVFKNTDKTIPEIAEQLNVNFILEGSYRESGDRLKITAQLILAKEDKHIWSKIYERPKGDFFDIQSDIAQKVAAELKGILTSEEIEVISRKPTDNLEAYRLYQLGLRQIGLHNEEEIFKGIDYFKKAIKLDPEFALAYNGIAQCYQYLIRYSYISRKEGYKAKEAIEKALELNPTLGEAYATLGLIKADIDLEIYEAEQLFEKAIELNPGSSEVYQYFAQYLRWLGRHDESISIAKKGAELDPLGLMSNIWVAVCYFHANRYDEAINYLNYMLDFDLKAYVVYLQMGLNYALKGMCPEAIANAEIVKTMVSPDDPMFYSSLGSIYAKCEEKEKTLEILNNMLALSEKRDVDPIQLAHIYSSLGDKEKAFELISEGIKIRSGMVIYLKSMRYSFFRDISSDPRFDELLREVGFQIE